MIGTKRPWQVSVADATKNIKNAPCKICGRPTKYRISKNNPKFKKQRCERKACIEACRLLKNERIRKARIKEWATGQRKPAANPWATASSVSKEEILIKEWFIAQGWTHQFHIVTGLRPQGSRFSPYFNLDFALPKKKLYVEIDGTSHRNKKAKDENRDKIMLNLGWRGLRISALRIRNEINLVKTEINRFSH